MNESRFTPQQKRFLESVRTKVLGLSHEDVKCLMRQRGEDPQALDDEANRKTERYRPWFALLVPKSQSVNTVAKLSTKLHRAVSTPPTTDHTELNIEVKENLSKDVETLTPSSLKARREELCVAGSEGRPSKRRKKESQPATKQEDDHRKFKALERWFLGTINSNQRAMNLRKTIPVGAVVKLTPKTLRGFFPSTHSMMSTTGTVREHTSGGYRVEFCLGAGANDRGNGVNYNEDDAFDGEVVHFEAKESRKQTSAAKAEQVVSAVVDKSDVYSEDEVFGVKSTLKPLPREMWSFYVRYVRAITHLLDALAQEELLSTICSTLQEECENKEYDADFFKDEAQENAQQWEARSAMMADWEFEWNNRAEDDSTFKGLLESLDDIGIEMP